MNSILYLFYWLIKRTISSGPKPNKYGAMLTFLGLIQMNIISILIFIDAIFDIHILRNFNEGESWYSIRAKVGVILLAAMTILIIYYKLNKIRINDAFNRFENEDIDTKMKKFKYARLYLRLTILSGIVLIITYGLRKKIMEILFS